MRKTDLEDEPVNKVLFNKHKFRKNNDMVAAMYAMYCLPSSLRQVALQYRKTHIAIYKVFISRGYKLRKKEMLGLQKVNGISFTIRKDGYKIGKLKGSKIVYLNRYIWEKYYGPIPNGYRIKHKDGNKLNNLLINLELCQNNTTKHLKKNGST